MEDWSREGEVGTWRDGEVDNEVREDTRRVEARPSDVHMDV